jgi:beta-barrel assembly-enhancing protease
MQNENLSSLNVLLFGTDLPTAGVSALCKVREDGISVDYQNQYIKFANLSATVGGFDHNQLQLSWQQESANYMLMPVDAAAQKALYAALPSSVDGLKSWKTSTKSQSMVWNAVLYSAGFLALSFVIFIWQYDNIVGWAASKVSMQTERKIGDSVLGSLNIDVSKPQTGAAIEAVRKIGDQLTKGSHYKYQFYVVENKDINAFAVPGGTIIVNSGLLQKTDSPNELAAVLAHEVQHVEQRHSLKNMLNSAGIAAVVLLVLGDSNAVMMIMAQQISTQYFSRQVEAEADLKGLHLLDKNHIDASGMATFFKKMEAEYKNNDGVVKKGGPTWFSSHPETLARIQAAEAYVAQHPCQLCTKLTWDKPAIMDDLEQMQFGLQNDKQNDKKDSED